MENQVKGYTEIQMDDIHGFSLAHWYRHSVIGLFSTRKSPFQLPTASALQPSAILLDFYCCENGQVALSHLSMSFHWTISSPSYIKFAQKTGLDSFLKVWTTGTVENVLILDCESSLSDFYNALGNTFSHAVSGSVFSTSEGYALTEFPLICACHPKQSSCTFSLLPLGTK